MRRCAWSLILWTLLAAAWPAGARAAQTVVLPASMCPQSDPLFASGFEAAPALPSQPSMGSGGAYPGAVTRTVTVAGVGTRSYYLYLPASYAPAQSRPLLLALHGAGGAGTAPTAAQQVRNNWAGIADAAGVVIVAPVGSGSSGGWVLGEPLGVGDDVAMMFAVIADAQLAYNIEGSRLYLWGYSAGGHVAHAVALGHTATFAAYGVSAGVLRAATCSIPNYPPAPDCASYLAGTLPKIPVDVHVGTSDSLYAEAQADRTRFLNGGWALDRTLYFVPFTGGHTYTLAQLGEIWNHLCPFALAP